MIKTVPTMDMTYERLERKTTGSLSATVSKFEIFPSDKTRSITEANESVETRNVKGLVLRTPD